MSTLKNQTSFSDTPDVQTETSVYPNANSRSNLPNKGTVLPDFKESGEQLSCQIITIADLNSESLNQQAAIMEYILADNPIPIRTNKVENFNLTAAAHTLSAYVEDRISSSKAIFVITIDPHVGQNDENDSNVGSKRVMIQYPSGLILVGPARWYMRVPEFHGHGKLAEAKVYEISLEKLIGLRLTEKRGGDVFDGASKFAPAGAGIARGYGFEQLGNPIDTEKIEEEIEKSPLRLGVITESCEFGNLRVELDEEQFQIGCCIAVRDARGTLLCVAKRTSAFSEEKGTIVAVNGSKAMITDHAKRALYLASVQGNLAQVIHGKRGFPIQVGEHLSITNATPQEIIEWQRYVTFQKVNELVCELVHQKLQRLRDTIVTNSLVASMLEYVYNNLQNSAE